MSVITKVFVVLLTVLCIAVSMATISFVSRMENWRKVANDWRSTAASAAAETKIIAAQMKLSHDQDLATISQLNGKIADMTNTLAASEAKVNDLTNQNSQLQNQLASLTSTMKGLEQSLSLTQSQLVSEQDFARKLAARNNELERRNIDLNDRTKELTISLAMAHQQNRAYLEQISAMEQRISQLSRGVAVPGGAIAATVQPGQPSAAPAEAPAVTPIRGEIRDVKGNLASLSVGSADGVTRGMTFMVYRPGAAGADPEYVATVEISRVQANESAGQLVRVNREVRPGDLVRDNASFGSRG